MNANSTYIQQQLQALRAQYLHELPEKIAHLQQLCNNIGDASEALTHCKEIERLAHALAGSGATFGCPDVSSLAREIFRLCQLTAHNDGTVSPATQFQLAKLLDELATTGQRYLQRWEKNPHPDQTLQSEPLSQNTSKPLIYIVDDDISIAEVIASSIRGAGYEVCILSSSIALREAVNTHRPAVIIMDMVLEEGNYAGAITADYYSHQLHIPVLFLSVRGDFEARLAAVRAGAVAYFVKPIETSTIIATIDRLTLKPTQDAYRILLVDDDIPLSQMFAQSLSGAGMNVKVVNNPLEAMHQINTFQPELIVLDIDMPEINGLDLGAVIRQFEKYRHIPIVFLTADSSIQTRFATMHLGADDFLTKPISPQMLIYALNARTARARDMQRGHVDLQRSLRHLEFLKSVLDEHAIVSVTDLEGKIIYSNNKFSDVSGYSSKELIGKTHRLIKSDKHPDKFYEDMWDTISSGRTWHGTISNRAKDGHIYDVYSTIAPKLDEAGLPEQYFSVRTDVTAIKKLKHEIQLDAERLTLAMEATDSGMWEWNITSGETFYSSNWQKLFGHTNDMPISWSQLIHPDDFELTLNSILDFFKNHKNQNSFSFEHRIKNGQNKWDWVSENLKGVEYDNNGFPARIIGSTQLINHRVILEQQKQQMQEQLIHTQKMETIGHLTAGIAHDFNNLLGSMLGYTELANENVSQRGSQEKLKTFLAEVSAAGTRAKELIAQMLAFSRITPEPVLDEKPLVQLKPIVNEVSRLVQSSIPANIKLNVHFDDEQLYANIQPVHLHQILLNLIINARDAIEGHGHIEVTLAKRTLSSRCDSCHHDFIGEFAELTVTDSGAGIPSHLLKKIFDPFFTTKEVGKGSGMGLSVVHGVTHALGGHIVLNSTQNQGTSFHILLPLTESEKQVEENAAIQNDALTPGSLSSLRIMVIDDELAMSTMLYELLSMHGAIVTTFTRSTDALTAFNNNPDKYDLVVTDETMPEMSGLNLSLKLLKLRPELPIILCTGYSEHVNEEVAMAAGVRGFLAKPLETARLITMAAALSKKQSRS